MTLIALPAFSDHTTWMLPDGRQALGDPGDAARVEAASHANGLALAAILVSRRRPDRKVQRAGVHIIQKERLAHPSTCGSALPDASPLRAVQEFTSAAGLSQ
jgi:hypothetical protein